MNPFHRLKALTRTPSRTTSRIPSRVPGSIPSNSACTHKPLTVQVTGPKRASAAVRLPQGGPPGGRDRRKHPSARPAGVADIVHCITDRDWQLLDLLHEHGTLTTRQITALLFGSPHTAAHRLDRLRELHLIEAFRPHRSDTGGRGCNHWTLGVLGARAAAFADDQDPPTPSAVYRRQDRLAASPGLRHLVGVNQFFADLTAHSRSHPDRGQLTRWWSELHTRRVFADRIRPDGHGVWTAPAGPVGFFLEHDTGTERPLARLAVKLDAYARLSRAGGPTWPVLFWLPTAEREAHFHDQIPPTPGILVATAHRTDGVCPADAVWLLHRPSGPHRRIRIGDMPRVPDTSGPLNPGLH